MGGVERSYKRDRMETASPSLRRTNTAELTRYAAPSLLAASRTPMAIASSKIALGFGPAYWALEMLLRFRQSRN